MKAFAWNSEKNDVLKAERGISFEDIVLNIHLEEVSEELARHREVAAATFRKDVRINIRLSSRDLRALQSRALKEGIPYQTLVSSVLHKYVDGQLVDKAENE